eukprot:c11506_g1_i1.p1 GENE.c11506_g1_i1~~c11506_g1_i1.p1  ORF type:complete len:245 (+),score=104.21 c11506_g1_i1:62-796(+)
MLHSFPQARTRLPSIISTISTKSVTTIAVSTTKRNQFNFISNPLNKNIFIQPRYYSTSTEGEKGPEGGEDNNTSAEAKIKELTEKLAEAQKNAAEMKDKYVRTLADIENVRRIAARDVSDAKKFAVGGFAKELLEVADNLYRATESIPKEIIENTQDQHFKGLYEGVTMTATILQGVFSKKEISRYKPATGDKFNPNLHNATFKVPSEKEEEGAIAMCIADGYLIHERVLRPAVVGVYKKPDSE